MQQESWKVRIVIYDQRNSTPRNPKWGAIKGGSRENLQPSRNGFRPLGKNDKERERSKAKSERVKSLEKTRNQELLPKHTLEWKVSHGLSKKQHQKEEIMRNRERISLLGDRHIMGSGTQGSKGGELTGPRTLGMTL